MLCSHARLLWLGLVLGLVLLLTVCVEDCDAAKKMKTKVRRVCKQGAKCLLRDSGDVTRICKPTRWLKCTKMHVCTRL